MNLKSLQDASEKQNLSAFNSPESDDGNYLVIYRFNLRSKCCHG